MHVRQARPADREWVLSRAPRLHEFGPPPWRERRVMDDAVTRSIAATLDGGGGESVVFVGEDAGGLVGFIHLVTARDFFTDEAHGHISDLVVERSVEGRGVGRALLMAGEAWARERGYRLLTLNVFEENRRARELYERAGYAAEMTRFVKEVGLRPDD